MAVTVILGLLAVMGVAFFIFHTKDALPHVKEEKGGAIPAFIIGAITNFFDTLGIGSFAPTTAALKWTKLIDERVLPGTLNVSFAVPVMIQAMVFITEVNVDILTLVLLIAASVVGSYVGAGIMSKLPKKPVKMIMGGALLIIACLLAAGELGYIASLGTGEAIGLDGVKLVVGVAIFFVLGALMSAGVGLYAPAMATVYLLGMSPLVAFPIMMGACAFLMPVGSFKFIREKAYAQKISWFLMLGAIPGVLVACFLVTSLPLSMLKWLVIAVVTITGFIMLYEGTKMKTASE